MVWLIVTIIVLSIIIILLKSNINKENEAGGVLYREYGAKYLGGLSDVEGGIKTDIIVTKLGLSLDFKTYNTKSILSDDIEDVSIKTHEQIINDVSLGKLMFFGIFAFGLQDKNTVVKNYLSIAFKDSDQTKYIILETNRLKELYEILRRNIYVKCS